MRTLLAFVLVLTALPVASFAADQRFVYGDTTNWYTYDGSGRSQYGSPSLPVAYYYADRDSVVYRSSSAHGSTYYYAPVRRARWTCIGSGCSKTPYVRPILYDRYPPRIYNYNTPAVFQPW